MSEGRVVLNVKRKCNKFSSVNYPAKALTLYLSALLELGGFLINLCILTT